MKTETQYEILKDYEDFEGTIAKGTRMNESEWISRCGLLDTNDCSKFTDWFKAVEVPIYNREDMIAFANYIIKRDFPKDDTGEEIYFKWKTLINH